MKDYGAIILAGGKGTRFNEGKPSPKPKVLYEVGGKSLINYSLSVLGKIGFGEIVVVVGYKGDEIITRLSEKYKYAIQEKALGTGDAASKGLEKLSGKVKNVMILYGADIYSEKVLRGILNTHVKNSSRVSFVTMELEDPGGFGRIVRGKNGELRSIVEEKVATDEQKQIREVNDGCYIFERDWLVKNISSLLVSKIKEYFLTDLVEMAINEGIAVATYTVYHPSDWVGVDSFEDIKKAEEIFRGGK